VLSAFEGNKAETRIMLPVIEKFIAARQLPDVTVVADAGMISDANMKAIEAAGLSFVLGMKRLSLGWPRSSATGSSSSRERSRASTANWRRKHGRWLESAHRPWSAAATSVRPTPPGSARTRTAHGSR
jgi:transposase